LTSRTLFAVSTTATTERCRWSSHWYQDVVLVVLRGSAVSRGGGQDTNSVKKKPHT